MGPKAQMYSEAEIVSRNVEYMYIYEIVNTRRVKVGSLPDNDFMNSWRLR